MKLSRRHGIANLSPNRRWAALDERLECILDVLSYSAGVAFRKLGFVANELLERLVKCRTDAALAFQSGSVFDWMTAAEQLEFLDERLWFYLDPAKPALEKATPGKTMTIAEVDANTALEALRRLSRNTAKAFWFFHNMTPKGAKKLVIPSDQRKVFEETGSLATITALADAEVRELRKNVEREIADAKNEALADVSLHPGEVARSKYCKELLADFWTDIGHNKPGSDDFLPVPPSPSLMSNPPSQPQGKMTEDSALVAAKTPDTGQQSKPRGRPKKHDPDEDRIIETWDGWNAECDGMKSYPACAEKLALSKRGNRVAWRRVKLVIGNRNRRRIREAEKAAKRK